MSEGTISLGAQIVAFSVKDYFYFLTVFKSLDTGHYFSFEEIVRNESILLTSFIFTHPKVLIILCLFSFPRP